MNTRIPTEMDRWLIQRTAAHTATSMDQVITNMVNASASRLMPFQPVERLPRNQEARRLHWRVIDGTGTDHSPNDAA